MNYTPRHPQMDIFRWRGVRTHILYSQCILCTKCSPQAFLSTTLESDCIPEQSTNRMGHHLPWSSCAPLEQWHMLQNNSTGQSDQCGKAIHSSRNKTFPSIWNSDAIANHQLYFRLLQCTDSLIRWQWSNNSWIIITNLSKKRGNHFGKVISGCSFSN